MSTPRTVGDWLASRTPPPPALLHARITTALGADSARSIVDTEAGCLNAAERVLARLFTAGFSGRTDAPDLLAADALVTYALEFAAENPGDFGSRATSAMRRFGELRSLST
jgi:hypothetical protein